MSVFIVDFSIIEFEQLKVCREKTYNELYTCFFLVPYYPKGLQK